MKRVNRREKGCPFTESEKKKRGGGVEKEEEKKEREITRGKKKRKKAQYNVAASSSLLTSSLLEPHIYTAIHGRFIEPSINTTNAWLISCTRNTQTHLYTEAKTDRERERGGGRERDLLAFFHEKEISSGNNPI